jgi:hypothetical protein
MIKVVGILAVILIHCLRPVWSPHATPAEHFLNQELRFAVPGFLFCSGFLYATSRSVGWKETRSRLTRILIPYAVASMGAEIWRFVDNRPRNAVELLQDFLLGGAFGHYYYIFVIVGLVIATPVFARMSRRALVGTMFFVFLFQFVTIAIESFIGIETIDVIPRFWLIRLPLLWWNFFLLGWLIQQDYARLQPWGRSSSREICWDPCCSVRRVHECAGLRCSHDLRPDLVLASNSRDHLAGRRALLRPRERAVDRPAGQRSDLRNLSFSYLLSGLGSAISSSCEGVSGPVRCRRAIRGGPARRNRLDHSRSHRFWSPLTNDSGGLNCS